MPQAWTLSFAWGLLWAILGNAQVFAQNMQIKSKHLPLGAHLATTKEFYYVDASYFCIVLLAAAVAVW